ncbi:ribose pyranase [Alkalispirochaeta sphaeroplastigenens]|uniref:D-ribose pyranase n=1 Tax=Alkalispirochaeta sphaeroplastigenens TaxID=1187066 RepID=A0A2S4JJK3_9SPIO|nr:D-ribose pyranase [Alkalispirochaeta sphaeroplastigenens]POQ99671.1 ribose pyranase [Alkalispirochaeta sphaeroplastigenens]
MKKTALLNQPLSSLIAELGHTDTVLVADAGLPCPQGPRRIDLALCPGIPGFIDTVRTIVTEMHVEEALVAEEFLSASPHLYQELLETLPGIPVRTLPHHELKALSPSAKGMVRTGEFSPYANVILQSGVVF